MKCRNIDGDRYMLNILEISNRVYPSHTFSKITSLKGMIKPVSSAYGINSAGETTPNVSFVHLTSASTPIIC